MDKSLVTIKYKTADGKQICVDVTTAVKELLEHSDRQIRSQQRQDRRRHTEYIDGLTDTTNVLPQDDFADLVDRMDRINQLYSAIETLSEVQRRRLILYFFHGLNYREIAEKESVNQATVARSVKQAKNILKSRLNN